ncbi:hypothetical protein EVAR_102058_1 [Eumeta japonica]|uniref:HAT C-terminal dimerisation domain-containing protein n=1 Tax=Eumeta variegata TaxID=151549 RepID=A0A4C1TZU3_EUMVA|nr:hypothetical protein EVAR_102058_1 [Eumeta japonica]
MPVTLASCERSFSKLKLIKTYLRSTVDQERLSGLAILSIERDIARLLSYENVIKDFAMRKARKNLVRAFFKGPVLKARTGA